MKASALLAFFAMTAIGIGAGNPSPAAVTPHPVSKPAVPDQIKAYCIDFNWARTGRAKKPFAKLG